MQLAKDLVCAALEALGEILDSLLDMSIDAVKEILKPICVILEAFADVANKFVENFEGMVIDIFATGGGSYLGGEGGISLVYSTTMKSTTGEGWQAYKFIGGGVMVSATSCSCSVLVGIGAFFWNPRDPNKNFTWNDWSGGFFSISGTTGTLGVTMGGQYFESLNGEIKGAMFLIGYSYIPGPSVSVMYSWYWMQGETFWDSIFG